MGVGEAALVAPGDGVGVAVCGLPDAADVGVGEAELVAPDDGGGVAVSVGVDVLWLSGRRSNGAVSSSSTLRSWGSPTRGVACAWGSLYDSSRLMAARSSTDVAPAAADAGAA